MRRSSIALVAAAFGLLLLASPGVSSAQQKVKIEVTVSHMSDAPGGIDPRAKRLHAKLQQQRITPRYESLKVLKQQTLRLALDEVGRLDLPNGRKLTVRPINIDEQGVFTAVTIGGLVDTDTRIKDGHLLVFPDGDHLISLVPDY